MIPIIFSVEDISLVHSPLKNFQLNRKRVVSIRF